MPDETTLTEDATALRARPESPPPLSARKLPALDGLRSMVLFVLFIHLADSAFFDGRSLSALATLGFIPFRYAGFLALEMFFVLSGFLITGILLDTRGSPSFFRNFYARRILRVLPLYYGVILAYHVALPLVAPGLFGDLRMSGQQHLIYWGYLVNFATAMGGPVEPTTGHLWSLAVEEQFYLLWPVVVYLCTPRRLKVVCIAVAVVSFGLRCAFAVSGSDFLVFYTLTFTHMDGLAVGALLAVILRQEGSLVAVVRAVYAGAAIGALLVITAFITGARFTLADSGFASAMWMTGSVGMGAGMLVASLTLPASHVWRRWFEHGVITRIGKYSYGAYVLHLPLAHVLDASGLLRGPEANAPLVESLRYAAVAIPLTMVVSAMSWHGFESRILRLKTRFPYHQTKPT